ncbi:MAG: SAM-dependent methyltransferase [Leptolyngbyaceae cyanobacterium]
MAITLDHIVPWGRSFDEYVAMFNLTAQDLAGAILGCGDGPAAFNATLTQRGGRVTSVDPLYAFTPEQIQARIEATYDVILAQVRQSQVDYVWETIPSVEALGQTRMQAMSDFLADYTTGQTSGRYVVGSLPDLPFEYQPFDLALVSHLLFLYSDHLSCDFHWRSLINLLRFAREVRVFPLLTLDCVISPHLATVQAQLTQAGYPVTIQTVAYEFQRGGNQMLVCRHSP